MVPDHSFLLPSKVFSRSAKIGISIALARASNSRHCHNPALHRNLAFSLQDTMWLASLYRKLYHVGAVISCPTGRRQPRILTAKDNFYITKENAFCVISCWGQMNWRYSLPGCHRDFRQSWEKSRNQILNKIFPPSEVWVIAPWLYKFYPEIQSKFQVNENY